LRQLVRGDVERRQSGQHHVAESLAVGRTLDGGRAAGRSDAARYYMAAFASKPGSLSAGVNLAAQLARLSE